MSCKAFLDVWKWSKFFIFPLEIHLRDFCKALAKMKNDWKLYVGETYGMKGGVLYLMHIFFFMAFLVLLQCASYFLSYRSVTLHTGFSVLVCTNQFFGDPIQCDLVSFDLSMSNINLKTIRHFFHVSWWRTYLFSVEKYILFRMISKVLFHPHVVSV